ncbi:MAG: porin family protein [Holosporaceae bacterium]|jgi:hypothetical protein|nr:porin family protein [Holosporaceae bacterium]
MKKVILAVVLGSFALSAGAEDVVVAEESADSVVDPFGGLYFGLGIGGQFSQNKSDLFDKQNVNRFLGTVVLGAGKVFNNKFYVGGEALVDFAKSKTQKIKRNGVVIPNASIKNRGITPELALRFGLVKADWLFYLKPAIVFPKVTGKTGNIEKSSSKVTYSVALGLEKSFCRKFSTRLEGEYVFRTKVSDVKYNEGFNIRALIAYNVKF